MSFTAFVVIVAMLVGVGFTLYAARADILDLITSRRGYRLRRGIAYGTDSPRQKLDLYVPDHHADNAPILIFFYGSDWMHGSKKLYRFVAQPFAARGITVAIPDYRLYPETRFPGFVEDGALAVAHVWKTQRKADGGPRPLILMGHSAGAHTAALLTTDGRYLEAVGVPFEALWGLIGISGAYDFMPLTDPKYEPLFPHATRAESQPITFVTGGEPPVLLLVGAPDLKLDIGNTFRFMHRIEEKRGRVSEHTYPGFSHSAMITALAEALPIRKPPVLQEILAFITRVLPQQAKK